MKGSAAVLVCLGIWTICISGQIPRAFAKAAAIVEGKGPADHVLKLDAEDAPIMNCELELPIGDFTGFLWKKGADEICTLTAKDQDCTIDPKFNLKLGDKKFNLLSEGKVAYSHAASYECTLTAGSTEAGKFEPIAKQLTVVGATACDPSDGITIKKDEEANLTCSVEYAGTTPKLSITPGKDEDLDTSDDKEGDHKKLTGTMTVKPTEVGDKEYTCKTTFTGLTYEDAGCKIKVTVEEKDGDNAAVGLESKLGLTVLTCFITLWLSQKNLL